MGSKSVMHVIDHDGDMVLVVGMVVTIYGIVEDIHGDIHKEVKEVDEMLVEVQLEVVVLVLS